MVRAALRVLGFELKGLASIGLWIVRRRHGVPPGATVVTYTKEQTFVLSLMLFAMTVETIVVDLLLVGLGVPDWVRFTVLIADLYGLLFAVMLAAASVTRPHVLTSDELRIRYAAYFDLRVPLDQIASVRTSDGYHDGSMVTLKDGRVSVAVSSRTNVTIELTEPITFVRPFGARAEATSIRFFADDPKALLAARLAPSAAE
ncbi:hypothetical protein ITP53_13910 [Nonomuraea sp. K274]|uniref:Uncharacterized protein n=1 Tax=Nonomuraea cypriaca TaxID=1187855 RepID=A0A931F0W9_9ACTN|nr:hypothetical protein [Nonomuraea cypriaca]MBF8186818.1 hypothetical protein [Nonomuraea cypriaca]